jgi:hypothetical protein
LVFLFSLLIVNEWYLFSCDFFPWEKHSQSGAAACFLIAFPVLRFAASVTGSAQLRTPLYKGEKVAQKEKLKE